MDVHAGGMHGIVPIKGAKNSAKGHGGSPNLIWHNGPIMQTSKVTPIFWGTSWSTSDPKIAAMDSFYNGYSNSNYAATSDEYSGINGSPGDTVTVASGIVDTSPAPGHAPSTSSILNEVAKVIKTPDPQGYYPVYVDTKRGGAQYCAWHSFGTVNGVGTQFAFFFNLDGDAGCDPQDTKTGHPQGIAALGNVSAHELSEARTDPDVQTGWFDSSGAENADKCAWTFNVPYVSWGKDRWKVQGEWSNNAYNNGTGYPNNSGQKGCVDGH